MPARDQAQGTARLPFDRLESRAPELKLQEKQLLKGAGDFVSIVDSQGPKCAILGLNRLRPLLIAKSPAPFSCE